MKEGDVSNLQQLVSQLDLEFSKLRDAYAKKDAANFNNSKKNVIQIQRQILGVLNG